MDIKPLLHDGFFLSPFYSKTQIRRYQNAKKITLKKSDLRKIVVSRLEETRKLLFSNEKLILIKVQKPYCIQPIDLLEKLNKELEQSEDLDFDDLLDYIDLLCFEDRNNFAFFPCFYEEIIEEQFEDYYFDSDEHLVAFILRLIETELRKDHLKEDLTLYRDFIKEILDKRALKKEERNYSNKSLSLMLHSLGLASYFGSSFDEETASFYRNKLFENAKEGDPRSIKELGYEFYEGSNGFPSDPTQSCYWLEKYYELTQDPDVARTLGYIYYYGRTTNGVPQGDKAFQYFAIGHIAGNNDEATYKLADCYLKGYGTPVSKQCAFNLVDGICKTNRRAFLLGGDSKFADVALRLGSYYRDGVFVEKDLEEARFYYLEARVAIKRRLERMEYIGDRSVAMTIFNSLSEVQNELGVQDRIVKEGGYSLSGFWNCYQAGKFSFIVEGEYIRVCIETNKKNETPYLFSFFPNIDLAEASRRFEYKIKPFDMTSALEFIEAVKSHKTLALVFKDHDFYAIQDVGLGENFPSYLSCEEIIYLPQTVEDAEERYQVVSVEFKPGSKRFVYLSFSEKRIGDVVEIESQGENKKATVREIRYLYEDQLPLPFEKMGKIK